MHDGAKRRDDKRDRIKSSCDRARKDLKRGGAERDGAKSILLIKNLNGQDRWWI